MYLKKITSFMAVALLATMDHSTGKYDQMVNER